MNLKNRLYNTMCRIALFFNIISAYKVKDNRFREKDQNKRKDMVYWLNLGIRIYNMCMFSNKTTNVYIASKVYNAEHIKNSFSIIKEKYYPYCNLISSWIYEAGPGETECMKELWNRIEREIKESKYLVVYAKNDDKLKGALVEVGIAITNDVNVLICGDMPRGLKTAKNHPNVYDEYVFDTIESVFEYIYNREYNRQKRNYFV